MTKKKVAQPQIELTDDKNDKDPFRRKQQKVLSDESEKEKDIEAKLRLGHKLATRLAAQIAYDQAKKLRGKI